VVVFIFPAGRVRADEVEGRLSTMAIVSQKDNRTYQEKVRGIFDLSISEKDPVAPAEIHIIDLPFGVEDVPEEWSFGNGTTIGEMTLKDGRKFECGWIVVDGSNRDKIMGSLAQVKLIFKPEIRGKEVT